MADLTIQLFDQQSPTIVAPLPFAADFAQAVGTHFEVVADGNWG